jgi:anaphase-promoting complex subunit 1
MAPIRSLGLYEPSAIRYLVAESILPPNPSPALYKWDVRQISATDSDSTIEEEVLTCGHHVVWSQGGVVKRLFSFQGENEEVLHAFTTGLNTPRLPKHAGTHKKTELNTGLQRSLVVVLRTQVHVFLLSGDSHVLPLHFEVESAFPAPFGFLLQRKESQGHSINLRQSLVAHQESHGHEARIHRKNISLGHSNRPRLVLPELSDIVSQNDLSSSKLPKVLSYTETMSDMGLVVQGKQSDATNPVEMLPLNAGEDILLVVLRGIWWN